MKRILAGIMAVIIMLTNSAYAGLTYAETKRAERDTVGMISEGGMEIEGTNSFSVMLTNTLAGEAEKQNNNEEISDLY